MIRVVLVRFVGDVSPDSTHSGINQLWQLFCFDRSVKDCHGQCFFPLLDSTF